MGTRSIDAKRTAYPTIGLAAAAMLVVTLAACSAAQAQEQPGTICKLATIGESPETRRRATTQ